MNTKPTQESNISTHLLAHGCEIVEGQLLYETGEYYFFRDADNNENLFSKIRWRLSEIKDEKPTHKLKCKFYEGEGWLLDESDDSYLFKDKFGEVKHYSKIAFSVEENEHLEPERLVKEGCEKQAKKDQILARWSYW